jgi:hypothetical protein
MMIVVHKTMRVEDDDVTHNHWGRRSRLEENRRQQKTRYEVVLDEVRR